MVYPDGGGDDAEISALNKRGWNDTSRQLFQEMKNHTSHVIPSHSHMSGFSGEENVQLLSMTSGNNAWNVNNVHSANLKYTISDTIASLRAKPPRDRCGGVAIALVCQGVAIMTAISAFLLNMPYFMRAIGGAYPNNSSNATSYTDASNDTNVFVESFRDYHHAAVFLPFFAAAFIHALCQADGKPSTRHALVAMSAMFVPVILSTTFIMLDNRFDHYIYFIVFFISFVLLGSTAGVLLSSVFSLVPFYPPKYINFVLIGMNLSGVIINCIQFVIRIFTTSAKISVVYCMVCAVLVLSLAVITYLLITLSKLHRHYKYLHYLVTKDYFETEDKSYAGFPYTLKKAGCVLVCTFLIHFTSYSIYPVVLKDTPSSSLHDFIPFPDEHWATLTKWLAYSVFSLFGNLTAHACQAPGPRWLSVPTLLRFLAVLPLYAITNYHQHDRLLPVFIDIDVCKLTLTALMAYTGGYLASLALIYAPRLVQTRYNSVAGMLTAVMLALGVGGGVCASRLYTFLVQIIAL